MPPIYLGDTPVTIYQGDSEISSIAIGDTIIAVYT